MRRKASAGVKALVSGVAGKVQKKAKKKVHKKVLNKTYAMDGFLAQEMRTNAHTGDQELHFLVRWRDYEPSWEPASLYADPEFDSFKSMVLSAA